MAAFFTVMENALPINHLLERRPYLDDHCRGHRTRLPPTLRELHLAILFIFEEAPNESFEQLDVSLVEAAPERCQYLNGLHVGQVAVRVVPDDVKHTL